MILVLSKIARTALAAAVIVSTGACSAERAATPTEVVVQFYTMRDAVGVTGAPTSSELAALRPFITDSLARLLVGADSMRSADKQRAPDEKPAFVEGDLFSSLFEGYTRFRPIVAVADSNPQRVLVEFTYDKSPPTVTWTDTVFVTQQNNQWLVHDVRYGGTWDFSNKGSLLKSLATP